jgi:hypothetical protein
MSVHIPSNFASHAAAQAPAVPTAPAMTDRSDEPAQVETSELILVHILRFLTDAGSGRQLTTVDRAFLVGARAAFQDLIVICDRLLERKPETNASRPTSTTCQPTTAEVPLAHPSEDPGTPYADRTSRKGRKAPPKKEDA